MNSPHPRPYYYQDLNPAISGIKARDSVARFAKDFIARDNEKLWDSIPTP
jgi:hypothetical protein